jgi:hypothetical protein
MKFEGSVFVRRVLLADWLSAASQVPLPEQPCTCPLLAEWLHTAALNSQFQPVWEVTYARATLKSQL